MPEPAAQPPKPRRTSLVLALLATGILLVLALLSLTFVLPPERIGRHFNKAPRDIKVTLTGYSFSINYGLKYEYSAQCDGHTYSVRYSIVPWGNIEVPPP
jgi:hypothetical protein